MNQEVFRIIRASRQIQGIIESYHLSANEAHAIVDAVMVDVPVQRYPLTVEKGKKPQSDEPVMTVPAEEVKANWDPVSLQVQEVAALKPNIKLKSDPEKPFQYDVAALPTVQPEMKAKVIGYIKCECKECGCTFHKNPKAKPNYCKECWGKKMSGKMQARWDKKKGHGRDSR